MRLKDIRIGTQLHLGLGLILAFVAFLGVLAWIQTEQLWLQTKMIYDHPLQVRRAVGGLEVEVEDVSRHVRDGFPAQNDQETAAFLQRIEIEKADAARQVAVLYDRYLGSRDDVITLRNDFVKWNILLDETVRLFRAGKTSEAEARIRPGGVQSAQTEVVRSRLRKIDDFARKKGDQLYRRARERKDTLNRHLAVCLATILLLSLIVSYVLLRGIKEPLQHLTMAAVHFRQGKMDVRSGYASANEFGELSTAFDDMADAVQTETRVNENAAQLAGMMLRETEVRAFCRELLKALIGHTDSQIAAVYFLNPQKTEFEHFESIGLGAGGRASFSAAARGGEFGAALATGRMQRITDIPEDTRFTFATVGGELRPREIITIPLHSHHETGTVIILACVRGYDKGAVRLLETVRSALTARMNGVLAYQQVREFAERLDRQNRELEAQKEKLAAQADELVERNTELGIQKEQLGEANRLKSVFLSNMSHELRTPLNSVIALSGVLNRRLAGTISEEEFGYLEVIERNGKHLLSLINDILDLSRAEAGREEISLGQFSIRALTAEIVVMLEPQAREKDIALLNQVGDDVPPVTSDPAKFRHILENLVGNAVKFTETGSVEISARRVDDELYVSVRDTGIGIAADELPHIFEEFRQADEGASRKYGGAGLGLAIAAGYATLLHGVITVESTPGQGSTFTLRLPLTLSRPGGAAGQGQCILPVEDSEPAIIQRTDILTGQDYEVRTARNGKEALAQMEKAPPARRAVRKPRFGQPVILVVEDNPDNLGTMRVLLQDSYGVLEAVDGRAGVELARRHVPDLILMDLALPVLDGFAALAEIREDEALRHIPVVAVTARAMKGDREEILARGFDGYISKPVEEELLKKTIRDKMGWKRGVGV